MKTKKGLRWALFLTLVMAVLLPAAGVSAKGKGLTRVPFSGKEYLVEMLEPPRIWEPGGNFHGRAAHYLGYEESDNPCIQGPSYVTSNINVNKHGKEHIWGDFIIEPEAYAGEGKWVTKWHNDGDMLIIIGHGTGVFRGMTLEAIYDTSSDTEYIPFSGTISLSSFAQVQCTE